jgi:hypothetical protein
MDLQDLFGISLLVLALSATGCGDDSTASGHGGKADSGAHKRSADDASTSRVTKDASASDPNTMADSGGNMADIEIAGMWAGDFGDESIDAQMWSGATVVSFDNAQNFAITQNPKDSMFDPGKFNKLVWTEPTAEGFFYCTVDYGLDTADEAKNSAKTADDSDPATTGCADFPWSKLLPK